MDIERGYDSYFIEQVVGAQNMSIRELIDRLVTKNIITREGARQFLLEL